MLEKKLGETGRIIVKLKQIIKQLQKDLKGKNIFVEEYRRRLKYISEERDMLK